MVENEVQFLSWEAFRRMGPSILRLEISRLERLVAASRPGTERYNALVEARFELKRLVSALEQAEQDVSVERCTTHLQKALLSLSFASGEEEEGAEVLASTLARLTFLHDRMALVY